MTAAHQSGTDMLTELPCTFTTQREAQTALTEFRRRYRVALRGACIVGPDYFKAYRLHVPLGGTGFSAAEMASAIRAGNY